MEKVEVYVYFSLKYALEHFKYKKPKVFQSGRQKTKFLSNIKYELTFSSIDMITYYIVIPDP